MEDEDVNAVSPRLVAEQILWLRRGQDRPTTPMHAIKLVYLCHGWMLGLSHRPLINEPVEAWRYGPVVPSVYHTYKSFRHEPIKTVPVDRTDEFDEKQHILIDAVLKAYKDYSAWQLSAITHQPNTPWSKVYDGGRGENAIIPNALIEEHYTRRAEGLD